MAVAQEIRKFTACCTVLLSDIVVINDAIIASNIFVEIVRYPRNSVH